MAKNSIGTQPFGLSGEMVTQVGLGGEGILRTRGQHQEARRIIETALEEGITYFDSAQAYADSEAYYGAIWGKSPSKRSRVFQASKSASRSKKGALTDLEQTLKRLQTDYLDLWQIHDLRTESDLKEIGAPGGALEAFVEAKQSGKVRLIGITGHHDPRILTRAIKEWPVDAVMMPVNPVEGILGGFLTSALSAAKKKGIAIIGMKILGASHYLQLTRKITPKILIKYALSHGINVAIVGCSTVSEVKNLADIGKEVEPLPDHDRLHLTQVFEPYSRRLAFYRGVI